MPFSILAIRAPHSAKRMIELLREAVSIASRLRAEAELSLSSPVKQRQSNVDFDSIASGQDISLIESHLIASYQSQLSFLQAELVRERQRADKLQQELEDSRESERIGDIIITKLSLENNASS